MSHSERHSHASTSTHNYDKENGQAFREWVVKPLKPDHEDWFRRQKVRQAQGKSSLGVKGTRNLVDTVLKVISDNFSSLELDDLSCMFLLASKGLERHELPQLRLYQHTNEVINPTGPLAIYTKPLISGSFDFIVHLTISGCVSFQSHEFLSLPQLKNLGVLEILQPSDPERAGTFPRITDAIIREWSQQPNPFPVLRVLRIWGDDFTTANSLRYLSRFQALAIYDVAGLYCDWEKPAQDFGVRI
ncbi:hypothetical protein F5B20DRAFT_597563 [Whalleya microplaca]|nr:hypothetical protein F5B20DRAFT_597563 [Whalleya microplaca]